MPGGCQLCYSILLMISKLAKRTKLYCLLLFCLGCIALIYALGVKNAGNLDIFPWQVERYRWLLIASALWLLFMAVILILNPRWRRVEIETGSNRKAGLNRCLLGLVLIFCLAYGWLSIVRHLRFNSTGYDLAINEQIVWNTMHGHFFASSPEVDNSFADHFRPFLIVLLPFYAFFQSPITLLVIQVMVLASGAVLLYQLAKQKLDLIVALALAAVYILYPATGYLSRFDFHIEVFVVPSFIAAFYALEKDKPIWASVALVVPLLCKENMGLPVAAFGFYAFFFHKKRVFGSSWFLLGLITFFITSFWLIPTVRGESPDTFSRYTWLGDSPAQMIHVALSQPLLVFNQLTTASRLMYLLQLFLPVGFLILLGLPELIPAVPGLLMNMLAQHQCQPTIYCQYAAPIIPFVFVSAVYGLDRLKKKGISSISVRLVGIALVPLAFTAWIVDNPFTEKMAAPDALAEIGNADVVRMALQIVPKEGSLVTTNDYAPFVAQREKLYILGRPTQRKTPVNPDIIFINLYDQEYIVCDKYLSYLKKLELDVYGVVFRTGGVIVIQKDAGSNAEFKDFILNWNNCAG